MTILPSIDLRAGRVVRLKQGDYTQQINYSVDPVDTAHAFREAGAAWMHIVDLDGAKEGRPVQTDLIARMIVASGLKVEVGGGIRSTDDIRRLLDAGAERVVLGTRAMEDWAWFECQAKRPAIRPPPRPRRRCQGRRDRGQGLAGIVRQARRRRRPPGQRLAPRRDPLHRRRQGRHDDRPQLRADPPPRRGRQVPVIASGGIGTLDHVREATKTGAWGCIIGRSLYEGTVDLREAIRATATDLK